MASFSYKRYLFRIVENWFVTENYSKSSFIINKNIYSEIIDGKKSFTLVTNLDESIDEIKSKFSKNTQYEIRRCLEKDYVDFSFKYANLEDAKEFLRFYLQANRSRLDRIKSFNNRMQGIFLTYTQERRIIITYVYKDNLKVASHVYFHDSDMKIVRLLYSVSDSDSFPKTFVGRANRALHFRDMEYLKAEMYIMYDWGGFHIGDNNKLNSINDFKSGFGGNLTPIWNSIIYKTKIIKSIVELKTFIFSIFLK